MSLETRERAAFERALLATSYALGRRGEELIAPLERPSRAASELVRRLSAPDRAARAHALAAELAPIVVALGRREAW